jgi:hypothetical protein
MKKKLFLGLLGLAAVITPILAFAGDGSPCCGGCPIC